MNSFMRVNALVCVQYNAVMYFILSNDSSIDVNEKKDQYPVSC